MTKITPKKVVSVKVRVTYADNTTIELFVSVSGDWLTAIRTWAKDFFDIKKVKFTNKEGMLVTTWPRH